MKIDKRELLEKLSQTNLWQNLSAEEVRLYLLLIICADEVRGVGRLSPELLERCLGSNFTMDQLEKAFRELENLSLLKLDVLPLGPGIEFRLS